jgi:hypothetical protein
LLIPILVSLWGCTIAPQRNQAGQASFDAIPDAHGNNQNSGLLGFTTNHLAIITPTALARYDALAAIYGGKFTPPLSQPFTNGIVPYGTNGLFLMDKEHLDDFAAMTSWKINPSVAKPP